MDVSGTFKRRSLGRRSVLVGLGGLAAAGIAYAKSISGNYSTETVQYEEWVVPENESVKVSLSDNDTFENKLIDITAPGANLYIVAPNNPTGWSVRNIGFRGTATVDTGVSGWGGKFMLTVSGDGTVENVFIDNRDASVHTEVGGGFVPNHHSGTIEVRNTFIAGCGNNAFYGSNSGKNDGGHGAVKFYNCYHRDNTVSQFRVGGPGSLVKNCLGIVHDPNGTRGYYPDTTSQRARGIWARNTPDNHAENTVMVVESDDVDPWYTHQVSCISKSDWDTAELEVCDSRHNSDNPHGTHTDADSGDTAEIIGTVDTDNITAGVIQDGGVPLDPRMAARGDRQLPDPSEAPYSSYTSDGCPTGPGTVVEDHEAGGTLGDYYTGSGFSISQDSSLEGSYLVEVDTQWATIAYNTDVTSRGNGYRTRLVNDDGTQEMWLCSHVQDKSNPLDDCYAVKVDADTDKLYAMKRKGGSTVNSNGTAVTIDGGVEYRPEIATDSNGNVIARLFDTSGNKLAEVSLSDTEWSGGTYGVYTGSASGRFDIVWET